MKKNDFTELAEVLCFSGLDAVKLIVGSIIVGTPLIALCALAEWLESF